MKIGELLVASNVVRQLYNQQLPLSIAYKISVLVEEINPQLNFFNGRMAQAKGADDVKEIENLLKQEIEKPINPIQIRFDDSIRLSPADIVSVRPLIEFVEK